MNSNFKKAILALMLVSGLQACQKEALDTNTEKDANLSQQKKMLNWQPSEYAAGLMAPIGMAMDPTGKLWVTQNASGMNDATVKVVDKSGHVYTAIDGFGSIIEPNEGNPFGLTHLTVRGQTLYILHSLSGNLYMADMNGWKPGDPPLHSADLPYENISTYVLSQNLSRAHESNIYNLCFGPDGDLYIADAAANAIIKRKHDDGTLSVFAKFPMLTPDIEPVPTGIVFDGERFLVSSLGGFPFVQGLSRIFSVDLNGNVSTYKGGLTTLTDIALTNEKKPLVLQFASFVFNPPTQVGFMPFTGRISDEDGNTLLGNLMFPTSLVRDNGGNAWYVLSLALGKIYKIN